MYLAGFQTAYNAMTPGVYDIFKPFEDDLYQVLIAMEPFCAANPTAKVDEALWELVGRVYPKVVSR